MKLHFPTSLNGPKRIRTIVMDDGRLLDIDALAADTVEPTSARQYGVSFPETKMQPIVIYGDQHWIADGRAAQELGGKTVMREITITYGEWKEIERTPEGT